MMTDVQPPEPKFAVGTPVRYKYNLTRGGFVARVSWSSTCDAHLYSVDLGNDRAFVLEAELELLDDETTTAPEGT